jgi:acyl-coenzyme A synthetase/AMP-(fatty) acid ligase
MPSYLIPQEVIEHVELPRTSSGKIDRQAVLR